MAFATIKGYTSDQTDGDGLLPFGESGYTTLNSTQVRNTFKDVMQAHRYQNLPGVLSGGVCTAAGNIVTVPANTYFIAGGMVWVNLSAETKSFSDGDNWLWGCSDGELRVTTTDAKDPDFLGDASCLITKGNTVASVTTLDNTVQQQTTIGMHATHTLRLPSALSFRRRSFALADADTTLSLHQYDALDLDFTGTLTVARNVILPLVDGALFRVYNNTTGGFNLTLKGATGTGIVVASGVRCLIESDGTNYYLITGSGVGNTRSINVTFDGGGSVLSAGAQAFVYVPAGVTITQCTMLADQSGSVVVDVWMDSYANHPPTNADSITAAAPPTISGATKSKDATLTGWTTSVPGDRVLVFNVDSCTSITKLHLSLKVSV